MSVEIEIKIKGMDAKDAKRSEGREKSMSLASIPLICSAGVQEPITAKQERS